MTLPGTTSPHGNNDWSEDDNQLLRELSTEGLTASQIAQRFPGRSRNAVIGKLNRMGIGIGVKRVTVTVSQKSFWNNERLRKLAGCVESPLGYTRRQIAAHFGIGASMLRRGLHKLTLGDIKPLKPNIEMNGSAPKRIRKRGPITEQTTASPSIVPKPDPIPRTAVSILGLTNHTCRFPVAGLGATMKYCGAIPAADRPYCVAHCQMAYAGYSRPIAPAGF